MSIKQILTGTAFTVLTSMTSFGQNMVHVNQVDKYSNDMTQTICTDMGLTSFQEEKFRMLSNDMQIEFATLEKEYETNNAIYLNKLRVLNEKYDIKVRNFLTLEQYAIYLNNNRVSQFYDSSYEGEDICLERDADGDVYFKDEVGTIKICDDKFLIKNDVADTKLKVTDKKIKFKDKAEDKYVLIKEDKLVLKEDGKREVIKNDEAEFETDLIEIEIEEVASSK